MKLLTKLTLFTTVSKAIIVLLFVWLLPLMVERVAFNYTNYLLKQQEKKVFATIERNGIDYYLEGDSSYGSYTMLKEEYISLERNKHLSLPDTVLTSKRMIEGDTLTYRLLIRNFEYDGKSYTLEIGKTLASISQYNKPLQRIALWVLLILVVLTLAMDLGFTHVLLRPLKRIIKSKLDSPRFPYNEKLEPVPTSTSDFRSLDKALINLMHRITEDFERERAFTSNASHELMTPLGILQNKMENILLSTQDAEVLEKVSVMMKTLNRLKRIVRSLLLISRIENSQFAKQDEVQSKTLVEEVMEELQHRLEEKALSFSMNIAGRQKLYPVNRDLLFQLLYNIINNAIRYNKEKGSITVVEKYVPGKPYILTVADTGIGIAEKDIPSLFERFKKAALSSEESFGLGLSIVKSIADYHQIQIQLRSAEGQGTEVDLIFPPALLMP